MNAELLLTHLAAAVPLRIDELRDQPDWALEEIRAGLSDRMQKGTDSMLFGGGSKGEVAAAVGAWTTAIALMALQAEGGVDFAGMHWCSIPHCRANRRTDHADDTEPLPAPPPARPVETLPDLATYAP